MTRFVDVVNFNADASCLAAEEWLAILSGGKSSRFYQWLNLYVDLNRPVSLGIVGGTIADIATFNPESIALINDHPDIFEVLLRPFSHDVGLLRTARGFALNFAVGHATIYREFKKVVDFFLPPEFMLTGSQIKALADFGVRGVFVHPSRFQGEVRLPSEPYIVNGVLGSHLPCIPFDGSLTPAYLESLHAFDGTPWLRALDATGEGMVYSWRDGESPFLLPDSVERERAWLAAEGDDRERGKLWAVHPEPTCAPVPPGVSRAYPVHSFSAWFKEFRMMGFLSRLERVEAGLDSMMPALRTVWLQAINSDVLSAVEKRSPVINLRPAPGAEATSYTIYRSERGFEGEDYLAVLEAALEDPSQLAYVQNSTRPYLKKLAARMAYTVRLESLEGR